MPVLSLRWIAVVKIAFLGLGKMGTPMARRLLDAGHPLVVWNRRAARTEPLVAAGARAAASPAEAVEGADVVITMLANGPALESVLFGPDGAARGLRSGACLVEMSTIGPAAVHGLAGRLPEGVGLVDAPVLGSVDKAASGGLTVLVGGECPGEVEAVLARLGTVRRCGPLGSGAALKLVLNAGMISALAVLDETLRLARALELPAELVRDALAAGPLGRSLERARSRDAQFAVASAAKDLDLALAAYPSAEVFAAARRRLDRAASEQDVRYIVEEFV
jgi:3-hydroxyisobutyrate dehydrogenase-like beta-hydroxyacid dehydrogenase